MGNADSKTALGVEDQETVGTTTVATSSGKKKSKSGGDPAAAYNTADNRRTPEKREADKQNVRRNGSGSSKERDDNSSTAAPPNNHVCEKITDDQINVNMAMADLMAYLQVVANNSNQLPLTRRDDPELDRTVSNLSPEDYARKSAAFVPADVRVLGGTFTRYGRVWDLPTSEEYNASDGAHEPGRSYGGACCNTMLKVVYDAANELEDAAQTEAAANALFEDDDEDDDEPSVTGKSFKSGYSLVYGSPSQNKLTWATLLRQMKSEFKDVGYAQVPRITTTRKFDLNQPFSLAPDDFDPRKHKKRSLLIGSNYRDSQGAELNASHDDIRSMKDYIVNVHGFSESSDMMTILLDEENHTPPTFVNIVEAFKTLSEEAQPGDAVFVQFSGHGGRVLDAAVDSEAESYDEVLVPSDYMQKGLIRDTLIFKTLLAPMRYGVTVTIMFDSCDTGVVLELPYVWSTKNDKRDSVAKLTTNDDFSYVRFLKVVKTLYESSTFTQLGRTVGSALNPLSPNNENGMDDDQSGKSGRSGKDGNNATSPSGSIFDAISEACNLAAARGVVATTTSSMDKSVRNKNDNLFDSVMKGCSLLSTAPPEDEFSDEDTFKTRTEEDLSYYSEGESFETMTEDGYDSRRRSRRR